MKARRIHRIAQLRTPELFRRYLDERDIKLGFDAALETGPDAPLAQPHEAAGFTIGNRFCIHPMEGWDATPHGEPTDLVRRRWTRFGESGAKLIWGGEAIAVRPDGRANPNQLMLTADSMRGIGALRDLLLQRHRDLHGTAEDLVVGLQLTHSGRFARPVDKTRMEPWLLYEHPILNAKFHVDANARRLQDDDIRELISDFVVAARRAHELGFQFVDIKHCHGYLGHEFLTAHDRQGDFGGSFENRTRFLREVVAGIRSQTPGLQIGVRLSAFDFMPFRPDPELKGQGVPDDAGIGPAYPYAFGGDGTGVGIDLQESVQFLHLLRELDIQLVNITAGSPYYSPHIQRPALFPPSDGYQPPEDPLAGVARQITAVGQLKAQCPDLTLVGSGYSYLQEWLPHVAQHAVRTGLTDFVGLGRMVLSYPQLPAHVLAGKPLQRKQICRTFSDCTTGPRNGLVSGCFPLDDFYKNSPAHAQLLKLTATT